MSVCIVGIGGNSPIVAGKRLLQLIGFTLNNRKVVVSFGKIGLEFYRVPQVLERGVDLASVAENDTQVSMSFREIGAERNRVPYVFESFISPAQLIECDAQVRVRVCRVRL
jgi:hypothetical protein